MKRSSLLVLILLSVASTAVLAQKKLFADRLLATNEYLQKQMWNAAIGNFVRRADMPNAPGSDSWGITIVLDAYAYMVEDGFMKPEELKRYFHSSSALYEKTNGGNGARILAKQGTQIYVGGDDDLQWSAALVHCYEVTKDSDYLNTAHNAFNALIDLGFWKPGGKDNSVARGWAWNSSDQRPNGVSTAYGALAAARLLKATGDPVFKQWTIVALDALNSPQVGFFPRDMMVAANATVTLYEVTHDAQYLSRAQKLASTAKAQVSEILAGKRTGERNPTDVGDLAEGFFRLASVSKDKSYRAEAIKLINFFAGNRTPQDISSNGFYSRYTSKGTPVATGSYLGVPLAVPFLPEVAEMLKLFAVACRYD